jgi:hypothetical protein
MAKTKCTKLSKTSAKKKAAKKEPKSKKIVKEKTSPSAKKQNKPTTKGNDLPESVKWLLDFANLGSKPGEVSLMKVVTKRAIHRPPSEPGVPIENLSENNFIDENGNLWCKESEKTSLIYSLDDQPSPEELRDFLVKTGINVDSGYSDAEVIWTWSIAGFTFQCKYASCISADFLGGMAQSFVSDYYNQEQIRLPTQHRKHSNPLVNGILSSCDNSLINGLLYLHNNTLEQAICAYALDFWHNHRDLHKRLRQCPCCGKFEFEEVTEGVRGRKKEYCSDKCKKRFGHAPRWKVKESLREQRNELTKDVEGFAHDEIVEWLCKKKHTQELAETIFKIEKRRNNKNVKSLANFKRTYGKRGKMY